MQYYNKNNLPITIGQAIDAYGSTDIKEIKLYGEIDETHGFMVTDQGFYYCVNKPGFFPFVKSMARVISSFLRVRRLHVLMVMKRFAR